MSLRSRSLSSVVICLAAIALLSGSAFAWNCSDPLASRVDVGTTKPSGTSGNGDGQYFLGTGGEGIKGHYYVCEVPKTNKPKGNPIKINQTQTQNQNQSQTQTANGGSASSTATGGNAVSGSSSSAGVTDSGNSSNTNNNTAQGGAGGSASSTNKNNNQSSAAASDNGNGNGNGSNNYSSTSTYKAAENPVSTAFAPTSIPTANCFKGYGAGVQTMPVGVSLGGGKIDENCRALQTALHAPNRLTYCKLFVNLQDSKKAGITMADCMGIDPEPPAAPAPAPAQDRVLLVPVPTPAAPIAVVTPAPAPIPQAQLIGICTFLSKTSCTAAGSDAGIVDPSRPTSVCKIMIDAAVKALRANPNSIIVLVGNRNRTEDSLLATSRANRVKQQLKAAGVKDSQIKVETGSGETRTVEITLKPVTE